MLECFLLTFLNVVLSMAVGWIAFGAVYWTISKIQIMCLCEYCRKRYLYPEFVVAKTLRLRDSIWEYIFYGPVMPIMHHERKKQKSNALQS